MKSSETQKAEAVVKDWKDKPVGSCDSCSAVLTWRNRAFFLNAKTLCGSCFGKECV